MMTWALDFLIKQDVSYFLHFNNRDSAVISYAWRPNKVYNKQVKDYYTFLILTI